MKKATWQEVAELWMGLRDRVALARQLLDVDGRLVGEKPRSQAVDLLLANVELNLVAAEMNLRGAMRLLEGSGLAELREDVEFCDVPGWLRRRDSNHEVWLSWPDDGAAEEFETLSQAAAHLVEHIKGGV